MFKLKAAPLPEGTNNCDLCLLTQQIINHAYLVCLSRDNAEDFTKNRAHFKSILCNIQMAFSEINILLNIMPVTMAYGGFCELQT